MTTLSSKMRNLAGLCLVTAMSFSCSSAPTTSLNVDQELEYCQQQVTKAIEALEQAGPIDYTMMPRNIQPEQQTWSLRKATEQEWTSGFWPGILWYAYEASGSPQIKAEAEKFMGSLAHIADLPAYDHDLGFLMFCSYGNAYRLTQNPEYKDIIIRTSEALSTLFNPTIGTMLSWPREVDRQGWPHNTIMDNMINLEMLFWAADNGGSEHQYLRDIAIKHADTTMENHFRDDYTSYHVAVYDTISGKLIKGVTHQGYADHTMWARGQAWAIYGYTVVYRETKDPKYLEFVQNVADVFLEDLPEDAIPYWDFSAPNIPSAPRDASSAAIVASALIELAEYVPSDKASNYRAYAKKMLESLSSPDYKCGDSKVAFIDHSTGHHPNGSEIDIPIIYADYYYIEALLKAKAHNL